MAVPVIEEARATLHARLVATLLTLDARGTPTNADSASSISIEIANTLLGLVGGGRVAPRPPGQSAGKSFEDACLEFLKNTFPVLGALRPGDWRVDKGGVGGISSFAQYAHLRLLDTAMRADAQLAAALGRDYQVRPDIIIAREPEVFAPAEGTFAPASPLDKAAKHAASLHAVVSAKWTIRTDRAQNVRTEALALIRHRKGHTPHIVVVTGEPLPSRVASVALGTGDIDCVYHFALPEWTQAVEQSGHEESTRLLRAMVDGHRLRDIADLPLDLAI